MQNTPKAFYIVKNTTLSQTNQAFYIQSSDDGKIPTIQIKLMPIIDAFTFLASLSSHFKSSSNQNRFTITETVDGKTIKRMSLTIKDNHSVKITLIDKNWDRFQTIQKDKSKKIQILKYNPFIPIETLNAETTKADNYPFYHPFRMFGKSIHNKPEMVYKDFAFSHSYSSSGKKKIINKEKPEIGDNFFNKYPGYKEVFVEESQLYPIEYTNKEKNKFRVKAMVYVVNEFADILKNLGCTAVELDCSFFVLGPYVYCIPMGIICNESVPLGLSIGPTEHRLVYQQFYQFIHKLDPESYNKLIEIPVLSDEGSALKRFCKDNNLVQKFCYRHLINKFGANTPLGGLVKGLLFCKSKEEFETMWDTLKTAITKELNETSELHRKQFLKLFPCEYDEGLKLYINPQSTQAMWLRYGVPTCTNHAESAHSHLNQAAHSCKLYKKRLEIILDYIQNRLKNFILRRNLHDAICHLRIIAVRNKAQPSDHCNCNTTFKSHLYGVDFPCVHKVNDFSFPANLQKPIPSEIPQITDIITDLPDEYHEWSFPETNVLPYFQITNDDVKLSNELGRPNVGFIKQVCKFLQTVQNVSNEVMENYITMLFIHFSSTFYGYYAYTSTFCIFALLWISRKTSFEEYATTIPAKDREMKQTYLLKASLQNKRSDPSSEEELDSPGWTSPRSENIDFKNALEKCTREENSRETKQNRSKVVAPADNEEREGVGEEDDDDEQNDFNSRAFSFYTALKDELQGVLETNVTPENCLAFIEQFFQTAAQKKEEFDELRGKK